MTSRIYILIATLGSITLLLAAFYFQYIREMAPCKMCLWQRYPHGIAIIAGILALVLNERRIAILGALSAFFTSVIGFYHAGVEQKYWQGPTSCTSSSNQGLSTTELLDKILNAPLVRCDQIPWELYNISMAGWNGIISLVLVVIWLAALNGLPQDHKVSTIKNLMK